MNNTFILNTIAWISFNMREQGLFILNLIANRKLLPLQFIQTKESHLSEGLCHTNANLEISKYLIGKKTNIVR